MKAIGETTLRVVPEPESQPVPKLEAGSGMALATVLGREGERFRVKLGRREALVLCDPAVDPELVVELAATRGRVVLEEGVIVGALATARVLQIDREGVVEAHLKRVALTVEQAAVVATSSSFLRLQGAEIELHGREILARARELVRILGRMIKLD